MTEELDRQRAVEPRSEEQLRMQIAENIAYYRKQNGDTHSDWTGVQMDVDAYRKVVFEPYDLRVLEGTVDF